MDKCFLCKSSKKDNVQYGEFLKNKHFGVHTFCLYLSSNLQQNGNDDEGFLGFLEADIKKEVSRISLLKCCYCHRNYANIGCCEKRCRHTFHLICGIEHNAENLFCDDYRSYCHRHVNTLSECPAADATCLICYESLCAVGKTFNRVKMILTPCCRNGWFHKLCLQKFAQTAGYFFKCPLCNDANTFRSKLPAKGIFIPNQDAAWELEPDAFAELLERPNECGAQFCKNKKGRKAKSGNNPLVFCVTCGSSAMHKQCLTDNAKQFVCSDCTVAYAKDDSGRESPNSHANSGNTDDEHIDVCNVSDNEDLESVAMTIGGSNKLEEKKRDSGTHTCGSDEDELPYKTRKCNEIRRIIDTDDTESEDNIKPVVTKQRRLCCDTDAEDSESPEGSKSVRRNARRATVTESSDEASEEIKLKSKRNRRLFSASSDSNEYEEYGKGKKDSPETCTASGNDNETNGDEKTSQPVWRNYKNATTDLIKGNSSSEEEIRIPRRKSNVLDVLTVSDDDLLLAEQAFADCESSNTEEEDFSTGITKSIENDNALTKIKHLSTRKNKNNEANVYRNEVMPAEKDSSKEKIEKCKYINLESPPHCTKKDNSLDISCIAERTRLKAITNSSSSVKKGRKEIVDTICDQISYSQKTAGKTNHECKENFKIVSISYDVCERKDKNLDNFMGEEKNERNIRLDSPKSGNLLPEFPEIAYDKSRDSKVSRRQRGGNVSSASSEIETSPLGRSKSSSQFSNIQYKAISSSSQLYEISQDISSSLPTHLANEILSKYKTLFENSDGGRNDLNSHVDSEEEWIDLCNFSDNNVDESYDTPTVKVKESSEEKTSNSDTGCENAVKLRYANNNSNLASENVYNWIINELGNSKDASEDEENEGFKGFSQTKIVSPDIFKDSDSENEEEGEVTTSPSSSLLFKTFKCSSTSNQDEIRSKNRKRKNFNASPYSDDKILRAKPTYLDDEPSSNVNEVYNNSENISIITVGSDKNDDILAEQQSNIRIRKSNPLHKSQENKNQKEMACVKANTLDISCIAQRTRRRSMTTTYNNINNEENEIFNPINVSCIALRTRRKTTCAETGCSKKSPQQISQAFEKIVKQKDDFGILINESENNESIGNEGCIGFKSKKLKPPDTYRDSERNYSITSSKDEIRNENKKRKGFIGSPYDKLQTAKKAYLNHKASTNVNEIQDNSENISIITVESDKSDDILEEPQSNIKIGKSKSLNNSQENKRQKEKACIKANSVDISCIAQRTRRKTLVNTCNHINNEEKAKPNPMNVSGRALRTRRQTTYAETDCSKSQQTSEVFETKVKSKDDFVISIIDSDDDSVLSLNNYTEQDVVANRTRNRNSLKSKKQLSPKIDGYSRIHYDRRISPNTAVECDTAPSALPKLPSRFSKRFSSLVLDKFPQQKITAFLTPNYIKKSPKTRAYYQSIYSIYYHSPHSGNRNKLLTNNIGT